MSPIACPKSLCTQRFPRVSGDEPAKYTLAGLGLTFSPRERG